MKYDSNRKVINNRCRRTPQGVRGLKYTFGVQKISTLMSHPARGAWIEIFCPEAQRHEFWSHPARGAWIEMTVWRICLHRKQVAPRKGCVD